MSLGLAPTWNSPDITTNHWSPWRLYAEPEVTVRNLSPIASALNTLVHFHWSPFGIGMPRTHLLSRAVNLMPSQQVMLKFPLGQDTLHGPPQIGTYIVIEHPHDRVLLNSRGDQIHLGALTSEAGRNLTFTLPVRNPLGQPQQIILSVLPNELSAAVSPTTLSLLAFGQVNATVTMTVPSSIHGTASAYVAKEVTIVGRGSDGDVIDGVTFLIRVDD